MNFPAAIGKKDEIRSVGITGALPNEKKKTKSGS